MLSGRIGSVAASQQLTTRVAGFGHKRPFECVNFFSIAIEILLNKSRQRQPIIKENE